MANLNPQITDEKLLLLKGTRDKLATLDITPGAIYFTTDYPGIYVDFAAEGDKAARRVRMGDVTIVNTLSELKELAAEAITDGQKLGKETLYYAKDKNVLCIYDEDENKFVWVNDISQLQTQLSSLEATVGSEQVKLTNLITNDIGVRANDNLATSGKTIFKAIEDEYTRATNAETNLQQQINTLSGTGGGTIGGLQQEIDALEEKHNDYETATNNTLSDMQGQSWSSQTSKPTLMSNKNDINTINTKLATIEQGAQVNKVESITISHGAPTSGKKEPTSNTTDIALTVPNELAHLSDGSQFKTNINNITTVIGTPSSNHSATKEKTIFKAIEDEYDRAKGAEQAILDEINNKLATADAMTFKGAIGFKEDGETPDLPSGAKAQGDEPLIHAGDTYVLSGSDLQNVSHDYHAGDMFIAGRDQTSEETIYPSGIVSVTTGGTLGANGWYHVKTGYDGIHESKLSVVADADGGVTKTGNKIALTSHVGTALGSVEFNTNSTNLAISKVAGNNGQINLNLVWATF